MRAVPTTRKITCLQQDWIHIQRLLKSRTVFSLKMTLINLLTLSKVCAPNGNLAINHCIAFIMLKFLPNSYRVIISVQSCFLVMIKDIV
jgi:hypothetical protein